MQGSGDGDDSARSTSAASCDGGAESYYDRPSPDSASRSSSDRLPWVQDHPSLQLGSDSGVYLLTLQFAADSAPRDRATVVDELTEYLMVLSDDADRPYLTDRTVSLTIATRHDVATVRAALEDLPVVDRVNATCGDQAGVSVSERKLETVSPAGERSNASQRAFANLKRRTDSVDAHELLDDPAYAEFYDEFDELSAPEDEVTMSELLADDEPPTDSTGQQLDGPGRGRSGVDEPPSERATTEEAGTGDESVASQLLEELERGRVSDDERDRLRTQFAGDASTSLELRVSHLQSRFLELSSYIDAMEAFFDHGEEPETLLEDVLSELEALRDELEEVNRTQEEHANRFAAVDEEVRDLEASQEDIRSELETLDERWDRLSRAFQSSSRE